MAADAFRVLKPGGRFVASDWLISHDGEPSPEMAEHIAKEDLDFEMASPARYRRALETAGFVDVLLTNRNPWYRTVAREELARLEALLTARHASVMEGRPERQPGSFKRTANQAGLTVFVAPDLVTGTLARGLDLYRSLETPFQRAVFMMFLIAEVHPFADGNGRIARIMMNAELVAAGEERIIVPTVYRANYLSALKALSRTRRVEPLIRMLDYAQRWTAAVDWRSLVDARRELEECNAFLDSNVAEAEGRRLRMPS